jgi:hypothetical protein
VVAGFSTEEIARAFLSPEKTIAQRLVRAKRTIEGEHVSYVVPERAELPARLASVLAVVYLLFNEGHTTRQGALMRLNLQAEALRLGRLLCDLPVHPRRVDSGAECYDPCSNAWGTYINGSLRSLIATGKGQPNWKERRGRRTQPAAR